MGMLGASSNGGYGEVVGETETMEMAKAKTVGGREHGAEQADGR